MRNRVKEPTKFKKFIRQLSLDKLLAGMKSWTVGDKYVADDSLYPGSDLLLSMLVKVNINFSRRSKWLVTVKNKYE